MIFAYTVLIFEKTTQQQPERKDETDTFPLKTSAPEVFLFVDESRTIMIKLRQPVNVRPDKV